MTSASQPPCIGDVDDTPLFTLRSERTTQSISSSILNTLNKKEKRRLFRYPLYSDELFRELDKKSHTGNNIKARLQQKFKSLHPK